MGLVKKNIRFEGDIWEAIAVEATRQGVSAGEYVRTAVLSRLIFDVARHRPEAAQAWGELYAITADADAVTTALRAISAYADGSDDDEPRRSAP